MMALVAIEAEIAVLGGCLIDADAILIARKLVAVESFTTARHRVIYRAMIRAADAGQVIDPVTIFEGLKPRGELEDAGGLEYLAELMDAVPTAANLEHHSKIVADFAARRRVQEVARKVLADAEDADLDLAEIGLRATDQLERLRSTLPAGRYQLLTDDDLEALPPPVWLIDGIMPAGGLIVPYGAPGSWKTFGAIDWGLCVSTGFRWMGREVRRGPVIYIAAEGASGLGARVRAWKDHRRFIGRTDLHVIAEPVNLLEAGDVANLLQAIQRDLTEPPALVIFDTLARCMIGGDENNTADMGVAVENAGRIQRTTGAAVMLVHHTRKGEEVERGNSSLRGAADTMILFRADDDTVEIKANKQKDGPEFSPIRVVLESVGESCVVVPDRGGRSGTVRVTEFDTMILAILTEIDLGDGVTSTAWMKAADVQEKSFYRSRKRLIDNGLVEANGKGRGAKFSAIDKGRALQPDNLTYPDPNLTGQGDALPDSHPSPTPLKGGGGSVRASGSGGERSLTDRSGSRDLKLIAEGPKPHPVDEILDSVEEVAW